MQSVWFLYVTLYNIHCTLHHNVWNKKVMGNCCFLVSFIPVFFLNLPKITLSVEAQLTHHLALLQDHWLGSLNYSKGPLLTKVWKSCNKFPFNHKGHSFKGYAENLWVSWLQSQDLFVPPAFLYVLILRHHFAWPSIHQTYLIPKE
jgi:hypothetical protein